MGQPISVIVPHQLGAAEARRRIDEGFGGLAARLGNAPGSLDRRWTGDRLDFSLTSFGQGISGHVTVAATSVTIEVLLPGVLGMLAAGLTGTIRREGQFLLEKK